MKTVRTAVALAATLLMGGGYLASQSAYFVGDPAQYTRALDQSGVPLLSLVLLLSLVGLAIVPDKEAPGDR